MALRQLEIVAFDIGGVLARIDKAPIRALLANHKVEESRFFNRNFEALQMGHLKPTDFLSEVCLDIGLSFEDATLAFKKILQIDAAAQLISKLRVPHFFMSNINAMHFEVFCETVAMSSCAQKYSLLSYQVGCLKPSLQFFQRLAPSIREKAHGVLYIDDQPKNLLVANTLGFMTTLCRQPEDLSTLLRTYRLI